MPNVKSEKTENIIKSTPKVEVGMLELNWGARGCQGLFIGP